LALDSPFYRATVSRCDLAPDFAAADQRKLGTATIAVLLLGLLPRIYQLGRELDGHFVSRQAHVASNIEFFLNHGIGVATRTFNKRELFDRAFVQAFSPGAEGAFVGMNPTNLHDRVFDFPFYQIFVALLSKVTSWDALLTARATNVAVYLMTCFILLDLMTVLKVRPLVKFGAMLAFVWSPLQVFYSGAVIPDNLAVMFSFASLLSFVKWREEVGGSAMHYLGAFVAGSVAVLIKSPCHLPVVFAMVAYWIVTDGRLPARRTGSAILFGGLLLEALLFKAYSNHVNSGYLATPAWDRAWYFGHLTDRFSVGTAFRIGSRLLVRAVNPLLFVLALLGAFARCRDIVKRQDSPESKAIWLGLVLGMLATIEVFLPLNSIHDYYQIPFVFTFALSVGYGLELVCEQRLFREQRLFGSSFARAAVMLAFVAMGIGGSYLARIRLEQPREKIVAGDFIKAHTPPDAFVFYVVPTLDAIPLVDPSFLYFAHREGYNVDKRDIPIEVARVQDVFAAEQRPTYVFCSAQARATSADAMLSLNTVELASSESGTLYALRDKVGSSP
jgi:hypothetical protein